MKETERNEVQINLETVTLRFDELEPIVIPRASTRTRLRLLEWVYRLTAWPGMNVQRLRAFIAAVFRHHGWPLPENDVLGRERAPVGEPAPELKAAA
jgi:hypothetical protein